VFAVIPINPRELQKQLKQLRRMGIKMEQIEKVENVYIELADKKVVLEKPEVFVVEISGQKMFYIISQDVREEPKVTIKSTETAYQQIQVPISDEDVKFVAEYTGVSLDKAREAIIRARGDLAKAIEIIENEKKQS
jgi:nascent polypeptide-associated complex subunit alpha